MDLLPVSYKEFESFFLIMIRVGVIFVMFPFFNARVIPVLAKVGLALVISIVLFPVIDTAAVEFPETVWGMARLVLAEFVIGMVLGILVQLFFEGVRIMGQLVGFQTGFAITNILDPQTGIQVSIFANLANLLAVVLFLLMNGHHILLHAMRESFEIMRVGSLSLNARLFQEMIRISGDMFVIAIRIGAPAIAALLFTKVAFALIARLVPQMNIMIVAFPVQIVIGLLFFGLCLNVLLRSMERYLGNLGSMLINAMAWIGV